MKPVVLILGAGPRVGAGVASKFASIGYDVVTSSRKGTGQRTEEGYLNLRADFKDESSIPPLFDEIKKHYGTAPSVIVYNPSSFSAPTDDKSLLTVPVDKVVSDLHVNVVSPYVAAMHAVKEWNSMPTDTKKTFIYTGNILCEAIILGMTNVPYRPLQLDLGMGKSASSYWIGFADQFYASMGYRFFFADERNVDGSPTDKNINGPTHGDFYASLSEHPADIPWHATFVSDKGFVSFKPRNDELKRGVAKH